MIRSTTPFAHTIIEGDITRLNVDGAIHAAAGPQLLEACRRLQAPDRPGSQDRYHDH